MKILFSLLVATGLTSAPVAASDQNAASGYPSRPVHIITPIAPGGNMDITVRVYANKLATILGQPIVVDNRPGAGSMIGIQAVLNSPADGYTLLAMSNSFQIAPLLMKNRPFDPERDFSGVSFMNSVPMALTVGRTRPDKTIRDLIARAKAKPGTVSYASGGVASSTHLPAALFALEAGLELIHVPYKGNAPAMVDVISGRVDFAFNTITSSLAQIETGDLRALAVSTRTRSASIPDVPTLAESGLPKYDQSLYTGIVVLSKTPRDIVVRLHRAMTEAMSSPEVAVSIQRAGGEVIKAESPEAFDKFLAEENARYRRLIAETGLKID